MEEQKRGPGRPKLEAVAHEKPPVKVRFVQMHDAFTPLQMAPVGSLMIGYKDVEMLEQHDVGIFVTMKGRRFIVPFGNISFFELE
jgi:hypothetical protein